MRKLLIANKWVINIDDSVKFGEHSEELPMFEHLTDKRMPELAKFTWCHYKTILTVRKLMKEKRVGLFVDYFGGIGRFSLMVNKLLNPKVHIIIDVNEQQYMHLEAIFPDCDVIYGDSFELCSKFNNADFISWDTEFTLHRLLKNTGGMKIAVENLVLSNPKYIQLADITASKFHLLKKQFSDESGYNIATIEDYYGVLSTMFYCLYGYSIVYIAKYEKLASILLTKTNPHAIEMEESKDDPDASTYMRFI